MLLTHYSTITAAIMLLYLPFSLQTSFSIAAPTHNEPATMGTNVQHQRSTTSYATGGPNSRRFIFEARQIGSKNVDGDMFPSTQANGHVLARGHGAVPDGLHKPAHKLSGAASHLSSARRLLTGPAAVAQAGSQQPDARQPLPSASAKDNRGDQDTQLDVHRVLQRGRTLQGHGQQLLIAAVGQEEAARQAALGRRLQDKSLQQRRSRLMLSTPDGVESDPDVPSTAASEPTAVSEVTGVSAASEDLVSAVAPQQQTILSKSLTVVAAGQEMLHALSSEVMGVLGVRRMLPGGGRGGRRL